MIGKRRTGILVSIVATVVLSGCGVRDLDETGSGDAGLGAATGTDTSAIQGFWVTNSGSYALISAVGEWTHIRENLFQNCFDFESLPMQSLGVNQVSGNNQYLLRTSASGIPMVLTPFDAFVGDDGTLTILESNNPVTVVYNPNTDFLPEDLQYCTGDE